MKFKKEHSEQTIFDLLFGDEKQSLEVSHNDEDFVPHQPHLGLEFQGTTYTADIDFDRLKNNLQRVYMMLSDGKWHTAESLRQFGGSEATRRIRDLRGNIWGPLRVESERVDGGVWRYRIDLDTLTQHIHDKILSGNPNRVAEAAEKGLATRRSKVIRAVRSATDLQLRMVEPLIDAWGVCDLDEV